MKHASIPTEQLQPWAQLNDVQLKGIRICSNIITQDGTNKGGGLLSTSIHDSNDLLLSVSPDMVLSKERVLQCAKTDRDLRVLIEALDDFTQTSRKAIALFLLFHMTIASPDLVGHSIGVKGPFTDYVRSLPKVVPLPTFFSQEERELLIGTSLLEALEQKLSSLEREYEILRERTQSIEWCQQAWWNESTGYLTFDDWLLADALYRSRALELPRGLGDVMVPVLDMANHDGNTYNARFEIDEEGRALLRVREGVKVSEDEELNISYGPGGASETMFSYGFLEEDAQSAREMFLSLQAPEDDPLRTAKMHFAKEAPGVRLFCDTHGHMQWESSFVWWACVNEEDGLDFKILQTIDGKQELQARWKGHPLDPGKLETLLKDDPHKDIFTLRAVVTLQERIERQGEDLSATQAAFEEVWLHIPDNRRFVHRNIRHLRQLELNLLTESFGALENQKQELLRSRTVTEYLAANVNNVHEPEGHQEEDFS